MWNKLLQSKFLWKELPLKSKYPRIESPDNKFLLND